MRDTLYDSARFAAIALFCIGTASAFGWLLAYFHIPQLVVNAVSGWGGGITSVGFITAAAFLFIGCFIDAIPAIIIVGTILAPLAAKVGMHPIHFAIIGVISIAYGLVTPPYGLCLMIACSIGGIKIKDAVRDTLILFMPMLLRAADRDLVSGPDAVAAAAADARLRQMSRFESIARMPLSPGFGLESDASDVASAAVRRGIRRDRAGVLSRPGAGAARPAPDAARSSSLSRAASARPSRTSSTSSIIRKIPNILILSNRVEDGKPLGLADAGTYFHTDYSYLDVPARATTLYSIEVPSRRRQHAVRQPVRGVRRAARRR